MIKDIRLVGTTSTAGASTITATDTVRGYLERIEWAVGTLSTATTSATISVTRAPSGVDETLITLSSATAIANGIYYPRVLVHDSSGTALSGTSGGDRVRPCIAGLLKCVIAGGGSALTGGAIVYVDEE